MALRALVGVKRVLDYAAKVCIQPDKRGVSFEGQRFSTNPFCEIAVEAAVRLKEQNLVSEILAVSIGCDRSKEQLQTAMALGADRAMLIKTMLRDDQLLQPLIVAKIFRAIVDREKPDIVILGKQAIDSDSNQVGQLLAALLGWPQVTFCSSLDVTACSNGRHCIFGTREVDQGLQKVKVPLPAVVTCDLRLNQPRYVTLPNLMKSRKRTIEAETAENLGVDARPISEVLCVEEPVQRRQGVKVASVDDLLEKLRDVQVIS